MSQQTDWFTGDGHTQAFALTYTPSPASSLQVFWNGLLQPPGEYSLAGGELTTDFLPIAGDSVAAVYFYAPSSPSPPPPGPGDGAGPIIPDYVPRHFAQGTTVKFTRSLPEFSPSGGWGYTLYLNGLAQKLNKAATEQDPATFLIELTPTDTGGLAPGPYRYAERLVNDGSVDSSLAGETYDITGDELVIIVEPSAASSAAGAFQTFEEKTLAAIEAVIANRVSGAIVPGDIEAYHIAGRAVTKIPLRELLALRGMYSAVVWRQQHPGKLSKPWKVDFSTEDERTNLPPTWQDVTGLDY